MAVGARLDPPAGARVLDASGCAVGPGLVDLHTHLREPGAEEAETIGTGARAGALGGYTARRRDAEHRPRVRRRLGRRRRARACARCELRRRRRGRADRRTRWAARSHRWPRWPPSGSRSSPTTARASSDGDLMRRAIEYARGLGVTCAQHCEDRSARRRRGDARRCVVLQARARGPARARRDRSSWRATSGSSR